jgi:hypothetical protein
MRADLLLIVGIGNVAGAHADAVAAPAGPARNITAADVTRAQSGALIAGEGSHLRASLMSAPIEAEPRFGMCGHLSAFPAERQEMS